jgi:hypothetical protein
VAVGHDAYTNGTVVTSSTGTDWTAVSSGIALEGVTYGDSTFVAIGYDSATPGSTILISHDGKNWTTVYSGSLESLTGVTYGNGMFVSVGYEGTILTSKSGGNWNAVSPRPNLGSIALYGVSYGNGIFVAFGYDNDMQNGIIVTSADGVDWTTVFPGTEHPLTGITYGKGVFVAVGDGILTSSDGIAWASRNSGDSKISPSAVSYANGFFVAVGGEGILTSPDGVAWARRGFAANALTGITYGAGTFVAVGLNGTIIQSDPMNDNCIATLSPSLDLWVPAVVFNGSYFSADFQYQTGGSDVMFGLTKAMPLANPGDYKDCQAPTLSFDNTYRLHVPAISFRNAYYWADFEYVPTPDGQTWFRLTGVGIN